MEIFGVDVTPLDKKGINQKIEVFLSKPGFHRIATVNPEFLVLGDRNQEFKQSLLSADLCVADGFGIVLVGWFQGKKNIARFPGALLMEEILSKASVQHFSVFLVIKKDGLSSYTEIKNTLLKKYPSLLIDGIELDIKSDNASYVIPHTSNIILCNFGAPEQEFFLESLRKDPGDIRLAMGVGGSFDYLTGKVPRAPKVFQSFGLEWLWRFILQPSRFKRIWNAVIVFPVRVFCRK